MTGPPTVARRPFVVKPAVMRILSSPQRLLASGYVALKLRGQCDVPWQSRQKIEALRDRRLRQIVRHAARTVPYYRAWFKREGLDPRHIRGLQDLHRLPVLDRQMVRAEPEQFRSETAAPERGLAFRTSGTTGTPLQVWHDHRSVLANLAYGERERQALNQVCGGAFRPKEVYVGYETSTFKTVTAFYADRLAMPIRPRRRFVALSTPIETIVAIVNEERPDLLVGYGGWLDVFFRSVHARALALHRPRAVVYMGEALPPGGREFIETTFGIAVHSRYNAVESFKIGFTCEHRTGFHLHEDLCCIRILDDRGVDLPTGQSGRVVITNLINRATVLINYPIGDRAALAGGDCPCGRSFARLSEVEGREEDGLLLVDGRYLHPRTIWSVFKGDAGVLQYQLSQVGATHFRLALVTLDEPTFSRSRARALEQLHDLLGPQAEITVERVPESIRQSGAKFRAVLSRCGGISPREAASS